MKKFTTEFKLECVELITIQGYPVKQSAFYLFPFRAWEMLAGGLLFLYPFSLSDAHRKICFYTGVALICVSVTQVYLR